MTVYTSEDDGSSISVACGATFRVRLRENRTTGYRWHVAEVDEAILELTGDDAHPPDPTRPGASGEHAWEFTARALGQSDLRLVYRRSFGSRAPAQTFSLTVSVT